MLRVAQNQRKGYAMHKEKQASEQPEGAQLPQRSALLNYESEYDRRIERK
jgi:hypothetical protein